MVMKKIIRVSYWINADNPIGTATAVVPDVFYTGFHLQAELVRTLLRRQQILDLGPLLDAEPAAWREANYAPKIIDLGRLKHGDTRNVPHGSFLNPLTGSYGIACWSTNLCPPSKDEPGLSRWCARLLCSGTTCPLLVTQPPPQRSQARQVW